MEAHDFKAFTPATVDATEVAWTKACGKAGIFPTEIEQVFAWTRAHVTPEGGAVAYALIPRGSDVATAVAEVVVTHRSRRSKWIKMIRMRLHPELESRLYAGEIEAYQDALLLFAIAFTGVLKLRNGEAGAIVKIYGRSSEQLNFLKALAPELQKRAKGHVFRMDGRWLVVETA